jgi:hypothetical protein
MIITAEKRRRKVNTMIKIITAEKTATPAAVVVVAVVCAISTMMRFVDLMGFSYCYYIVGI